MFLLLLTLTNFILLSWSSTSELPSWHMKPLGSHREPDKVDESFVEDLISPQKFAEYVLQRKPIVLRGVAKEWPAFKLWTDEYLAEKYGDMELRIEGKKEKHSGIPKGDVCLGRDRLRTFLSEYKKGANKYVVSELPTPMWGEVKLPSSVSCGEFLNNFVEIDVWMNSDMGKKGKGGSSIIHKDAFNTLNCVVSGKKDWKLVELQYNDFMYQAWEGPLDRGYGGYSLINSEKVDAKRFPKVGNIPRWQFTTINAGDCLYLPSQMWHQVKSYGAENRAVAFLFSQFKGRKQLNLTKCGDKNPEPVFLADVDVDLQYPGTGIMSMGNNELESVMQELSEYIVDPKKGYITKRRVFTLINMNHENFNRDKEKMVSKSKAMYKHLINIAGGKKEAMTQEFVDNLTRAQVRACYTWLFPIEPSNSYEHEYSYFSPERLQEMVEYAMKDNKLRKEDFQAAYLEEGGTEKFADQFWENLAGDLQVVTKEEMDFDKALKKYEYYRKEDPNNEEEDDDAVIITPQGHKSQPKSERGGYADPKENEEEEKEKNKDKKDEL